MLFNIYHCINIKVIEPTSSTRVKEFVIKSSLHYKLEFNIQPQ